MHVNKSGRGHSIRGRGHMRLYISAYPLLGACYLTTYGYKRMRIITRVYSIRQLRSHTPYLHLILLLYTHSLAGLLWSKQFYHYIIEAWLEGDPSHPTPPRERHFGRNASGDWAHLFNRDIISMPDKWEYPWVGVALLSGAVIQLGGRGHHSPPLNDY